MAIKKIIRSSILLTLGNMLPQVASIILLIPYTTGLDPSLYGELSIYILFSLLMQIIFNYGIDSYVGMHYFEHRDDLAKLKQLIGTLISVVFLIGAIVILIITLAGNALFHLVLNDRYSFFPFGFMSLITAFCNALFRIYVNFLFYQGKAQKYFLFNLINLVLTVPLCLIGLYMYPNSIIGPMWGRLLSGLAIFVISLFLLIKAYGFSFRIELISGFSKFCLPLVGFAMLTWVVGYINSFILNAYDENIISPDDVGIYNFAMQGAMLIEVVQVAMTGAISVRIFNIWKREGTLSSDTEENRYHHVFTMLNILFIAGITLAMPVAVKLFISNENFYAAFPYLPLLFAGFAFRTIYSANYNVVVFQKRTLVLPRVLIITSVIQIFLCIVLIKYLGIWGAVWSFLIAKPIQAFLLSLEGRKHFRFTYNIWKTVWFPVLFFWSVLLLQYGSLPVSQEYIPLYEFLIAVILTLIFFRKDFKNVRLIFGK